MRWGYLTGEEAIDTSRLTGLPLIHSSSRTGEAAEVDPTAAFWACLYGYWKREDVVLDLTRLPYWDRMKVAWARIGAHHFQRNNRRATWEINQTTSTAI